MFTRNEYFVVRITHPVHPDVGTQRMNTREEQGTHQIK